MSVHTDVHTDCIKLHNCKKVLVMVEGPAEGKAGDGLDWIARGLEGKNKTRWFW